MRSTTFSSLTTAPSLPESPLPGASLGALFQICNRVDNHLSPYGMTGEIAKEFFQLLMEKTCVGHTILGTKPVTEIMISTTSSSNPDIRLIDQRGWDAWREVLYPKLVSSDLVMRTTDELFKITLPDGETREYSRLLVYGRKNLELLCAQHGDRLSKNLGQSASAGRLLELLNSDQGFKQEIKSNHELAGMLYGYGAENSRAFAEMMTFEALPVSDHFDPRRQTAMQSNNLRQRSQLHLTNQLSSSGKPALNGVPFRSLHETAESQALCQHYQETVTRMEVLSNYGILAQTGIARWAGWLPS